MNACCTLHNLNKYVLALHACFCLSEKWITLAGQLVGRKNAIKSPPAGQHVCNVTEVATVFPNSNSHSQSNHSSCAQAFDEYPSRRRVSGWVEHMLLLCIASFRPGELNEDGEGEVRPNEMTNGLAFLLSHQTHGALMWVRGGGSGDHVPKRSMGEKGEKTNRALISLSHRARAPRGDSRDTGATEHKSTHTNTQNLPFLSQKNSSQDFFWKLTSYQYAFDTF